VAEERRKAVGSGLATCAGGPSAGAPAAASSGGGAGEARSPGGAAWYGKCDGMVGSGGGRPEAKNGGGGSELGHGGHGEPAQAAALWLRARRSRRAHGREKGLAKTLAHAAVAVAACLTRNGSGGASSELGSGAHGGRGHTQHAGRLEATKGNGKTGRVRREETKGMHSGGSPMAPGSRHVAARTSAWLPRTGQVSPVEALHRARGGQRWG
jgi:hypothetical protein